MSISWVDLVITGITGLGQPSIQRDVAFLFFDGSSYYHCRIRQASVSCLFPPYLKQQILFLQRQSSCLPNRLCASTSFATAQTKPSSFIIYLALFKMFLDKNKSNQIEMNWEVDRKFMPTVLPASVLMLTSQWFGLKILCSIQDCFKLQKTFLEVFVYNTAWGKTSTPWKY